jgi:hypothetical protein
MKPAMPAATIPTIHTGRCGECRSLVCANHAGSRPSRLIANHTRDAPREKENSTVMIPMIAPTDTILANAVCPTD